MSDSSSASSLITPTQTFQVDALSALVYNSVDEMAQGVAQLAQNYLQNILNRQETATVVLATGKSQMKFLEVLMALGEIDWSRIICFHLDEYLGIDPNHPASLRRYLRERVENVVSPRRFHYIEGDTIQPLDECDRYTQLLQAQPIDLCCLGVGENGHLAFNEPWVANFTDPYKVKLIKLELATRQQQVNEAYFPVLEAVPQYAFTLTIPTICSAQKILCLAPEKRKAKVIREMLRGPISTSHPASVLRTRPQATLILDIDSASLL
jgi:glucosamine-6-phosphate deaminase